MGFKVFLCDDAESYRTLVRHVLESDGFSVVGEACDGAECVERLAAAEPDVVLLDLNMPRLDGCGAIPALRRKAPEAAIVMLWTAPAVEQQQECVRLGARAYIQKPRDAFSLPGLLRAALA